MEKDNSYWAWERGSGIDSGLEWKVVLVAGKWREELVAGQVPRRVEAVELCGWTESRVSILLGTHYMVRKRKARRSIAFPVGLIKKKGGNPRLSYHLYYSPAAVRTTPELVVSVLP
jgi:hypothetical protein